MEGMVNNVNFICNVRKNLWSKPIWISFIKITYGRKIYHKGVNKNENTKTKDR